MAELEEKFVVEKIAKNCGSSMFYGFQYDDGALHGGYLEGGGGGGGAGLYDPHGNARGVSGLHHSPHLGGMGPTHPQYPPPPPQPPQHVLAAAAAAAASALPEVQKRDRDAIYG